MKEICLPFLGGGPRSDWGKPSGWKRTANRIIIWFQHLVLQLSSLLHNLDKSTNFIKIRLYSHKFTTSELNSPYPIYSILTEVWVPPLSLPLCAFFPRYISLDPSVSLLLCPFLRFFLSFLCIILFPSLSISPPTDWPRPVAIPDVLPAQYFWCLTSCRNFCLSIPFPLSLEGGQGWSIVQDWGLVRTKSGRGGWGRAGEPGVG